MNDAAPLQRWRQVQRAQTLSQLGRYRESAALFGQLLAQEPEDPFLLCSLASCHLELQEPALALEYADRAVAADPEAEWAHRLRSWALLRKDKRAALRAAESAVASAPHSPRALATLVVALLENGRQREAQQQAEALHALMPDAAGTYETLAQVALQRSWWHDAARFSREALTRDAESFVAHSQLAVALYNTSRYEEAASAFLRASRLDPLDKETREGVADSVRAHLGSVMPSGPGPYQPVLLFLMVPAGWFITIEIVIRGKIAENDGIWVMLPILLGGTGMIFWWIVKRHRYWRELSPEVRRIYLAQRYRWLRRLAPDRFDRVVLGRAQWTAR